MTVPQPKQDFYEQTVPEASQHRDRQDLITKFMAIDNLNYTDAEQFVDNGPYSYGQLEVLIWRHSGVDI